MPALNRLSGVVRYDWNGIANLAIIIAMFGGVGYLLLRGEKEETKLKKLQAAENLRIVSEKSKAKSAQQCATVDDALDVVKARGRIDLAQNKAGVQGCRRIVVEDCDYKVELLYELALAGRPSLVEALSEIGEDCGKEHNFARKHGIAAFRDHRALLADALEEVRESASFHSEPSPDDDYAARGRR